MAAQHRNSAARTSAARRSEPGRPGHRWPSRRWPGIWLRGTGGGGPPGDGPAPPWRRGRHVRHRRHPDVRAGQQLAGQVHHPHLRDECRRIARADRADEVDEKIALAGDPAGHGERHLIRRNIRAGEPAAELTDPLDLRAVQRRT